MNKLKRSTISAIIVNAARFQPMPLWSFLLFFLMKGSASSLPVARSSHFYGFVLLQYCLHDGVISSVRAG